MPVGSFSVTNYSVTRITTHLPMLQDQLYWQPLPVLALLHRILVPFQAPLCMHGSYMNVDQKDKL